MDVENEILELRISLAEYLSKMEPSIWDIVKWYRMGEWQEVGAQMTMLTDGLSWIIDAIHLTRDFHSISIIDIQVLLEEITEALENQDTVLLADLLEYELLPKISDWRTQIALKTDHAD